MNTNPQRGINDDPEIFRALVQAVRDYAIFVLDAQGYIQTWNEGAQRLKGYAAAEVIGRHFSIFYTPEALERDWPGYELATAAREGRFEDEGWRVRKDGSRFWANVVITALLNKDGSLYGFSKVTRDFTERKRTEETLRRSEEKFRLLVEAVQDYAIFLLDTEGRVSSWNIGAERIKGYKASEIIGRHFSVFYPEEDVRSKKPERELKIAVEQGRVEDEGWRVRRDGSRFWANVVITALKDNFGRNVGFTKVTRDITERRRAQEALTESEQKLRDSEFSLRELSAHLLRSQDEERRRIGRDLHDSLGQYLVALKMKLEGLTDLRDTRRAIQDIEECVNITAQSIKEVRTISYLLYPPMLEENGLKSAIGWYLNGFAQRSSIQSNLQIDPGFDRLPIDVELALFRVLQESLTNVHRHSGSSTVDISLAKQEGKAVLEIRDQGKGLPTAMGEGLRSDLLGVAGVGLRGMRERMLQIGGTFDVVSGPSGTTVKATVPVGPLTATIIPIRNRGHE
jgi:PAS domain S-box-containing protein